MNPTRIQLSFRTAADLMEVGNHAAAYKHALNGLAELAKLNTDADCKAAVSKAAEILNPTTNTSAEKA